MRALVLSSFSVLLMRITRSIMYVLLFEAIIREALVCKYERGGKLSFLCLRVERVILSIYLFILLFIRPKRLSYGDYKFSFVNANASLLFVRADYDDTYFFCLLACKIRDVFIFFVRLTRVSVSIYFFCC